MNVFIRHTVLLTSSQKAELMQWLGKGCKGRLTIDRITFEETAEDCLFISTVPNTARAKRPEQRQEG